MTLFEFSTLVGLAVVIALLIRIERILKTALSMETIYRERRSLEATIRDYMPTLWVDPEFREDLIHWFILARKSDKSHQKQWHWYTIVQNLSKADRPKPAWRIPPDEIERLSSLSRELFREAELSHLLTEFEVRYLLFHVWNLYFSDPALVVPDDVPRFESELSNIRERFFAQTGSMPNNAHQADAEDPCR
jgi:hypothetical protein